MKKAIKDFLNTEQSSGYLLILSVILALTFANTFLHYWYQHFIHYKIPFNFFIRDVHFWVNDGLMAVFFLLIGLEIKRELIKGELSSFDRAFLPVAAAAGGMIVPALIYIFFNINTNTATGWGVPIATDIAFALGILSLLGKRVPLTLKVFLAALAIADDIGAIIVIALFYTEQIFANYLFYAVIILALLILLNRLKILNILVYIPFGILLWYFIYRSGIHATISGVVLAFTIPMISNNQHSPLEKLEHTLHKPVAFFIMPLFAFVNTGIVFHSSMIDGLQSPMTIGIILGLLIGKPLGITAFSWLAIKTKTASLPSGTNWKHITGAGFLGGIGFTMSIFIALLSFNDMSTQEISKLAILLASVFAGITGYLILSKDSRSKTQD